MAQSRFMRMQYFVQKKATSAVYGLRPNALRGRLIGPKVLINSIPKAGTHLVESALEEFPLLRNSASRTLRGWQAVDERTTHVLKSIPKGVFYTAHLPAHERVIKTLAQTDTRMIFVVRDPRDIVISNYRYSTYIDLSHPTHSYFKGLPDDETRLKKAITGEPGVLTPIAEVLDLFLPWLENANSITIRFEDLVGSKGGGSDELQRQALERIGTHLGIPMEGEDAAEIAKRVFKTGSLTFNHGQVGKWRSVFTPALKDLFYEEVGARLEVYGYEYSRHHDKV